MRVIGREEEGVGAIAEAAAVGDLNEDGCLEIVTVNSGSDDLPVLLGLGDGTFQAERRMTIGLLPRDVVVVDVNGDEVLDVLVATSQTVSVLLARGDGTLSLEQQFAGGGNAFAVADFNGDGTPDFITGGSSSFSTSETLGFLMVSLHR